jgi:glycosyltransferase involved in cell wall biosynthesis
LIQPNKNGFLFEPDRPADLAKKLTMLLSDEKLRKEMGKESFKLIQKHDINVTAKTLEALYEKLIREKKQEKALTVKKKFEIQWFS